MTPMRRRAPRITTLRPVPTLLPVLLLALALALVTAPASPLHAQAPEWSQVVEEVDQVFAEWNGTRVPGCAVGVAEDGEPVLTRAWGMADLEHGVPNTAETIFENGSVSKQFTAAAVMLLALEGELSLDDDVRTYVPELPDYGHTITLRHLLTHTSGLRDWGSVAGISGWGRSQRTHDHADVVDILSRQSALNFEPGHEYSYSNSGYNLLAVVVTRVSGMPFARFSKERIFEPLGMHDTQWRDDYTRIVPGRSAAYARSGDDGFRIDRPIENVHGNGGLLTTVGDLLTWNRSLDEASLAGPDFVRMMETQGRLNDGRTISYASGVVVGETLGLPSVTHTGATSGYRAFLGRFTDHDLSVAVLCNVANVNPGGLGRDVARIFLGDAVPAEPELPEGIDLSREALEARAGLYREVQTGWAGTLTVSGDGVLRRGSTPLVPVSEREFLMGTSGQRVVFEDAAAAGPGGRAPFVIMEGDVVVDEFQPVEEVDPTPEELAEYTGTYHSDDAETTLQVGVEDGALVVHRRPDVDSPLRPVYADTFQGPPGWVRFIRNGAGRVVELSLGQSRVYDMRFQRVEN